MGSGKRMQEERTENKKRALEILEEVKAIEFCTCRRFYRLAKNEDMAYPYATKKFKERYGDAEDVKPFHEQIKVVLDEAMLYDQKCSYCGSDD